MQLGVLLALSVVLFCGCAPQPASTPTVAPIITDQPALPDPTPGQPSPDEERMPDAMLTAVEQAALADLATRLRIEPADIAILGSEVLTWSDGSLGCPQPGELYTQALVDGYRVILRHADQIYLYHAGSDARPFLCESPEPGGGHEFVPPPGFEE